jgi:hypothetical protein
MRRVCFVLLATLLSGCAQMEYNKTSALWERRQEMIGKSAEELLRCAGPPMEIRKAATDRTATVYYGFMEYSSTYAGWCVVGFDVADMKISGISSQSGNPGGFTDGKYACAYVLDFCIGDGTAISGVANVPETQIKRLTGDPDRAAQMAQKEGERLRDQGLIQILTLISAPPETPADLAAISARDFGPDDPLTTYLQTLSAIQEGTRPASAETVSSTTSSQGTDAGSSSAPARTGGSGSSSRQMSLTQVPSASSQAQNISINGQTVSGPNAGQPTGSSETAGANRPCPDRGTSREQYISHVQCECPRSGGRIEIRGDSVSCVVNGGWIYGCTFRGNPQQGQSNCSQR